MKIKITKAHGTQNTFIIIYDNHHHSLIKSQIKKICHQFNTDGLTLLLKTDDYEIIDTIGSGSMGQTYLVKENVMTDYQMIK